MKTNIGLSEEQRTGVVKILNSAAVRRVSSLHQDRNYHWNVFGPQFHDLHKFFEEQYTELSEIVDRSRNAGALLTVGHSVH